MINIDKDQLYPLVFEPVYKEVMWGGSKLSTVMGRQLPPTSEPIGEAWEICDRPEIESCVSNGPLAGTSIHALVENFGKDFVGGTFKGGRFPLLVKIIDAGKRLSLQVHPDEAACARLANGAEPKTEMWYIIQADKGSKIIAGLKGTATKRRFIDSLNSVDVERLLQVFDSEAGDAYFINAGRIHAIGAGNLLLEVQQSSDTTYRVSDWGRVGADGKPRALHLKEALECVDFMDRTVSRITGVSDSVPHNRKYPIINKCPFFKVDDLRLVEEWRDSTESTDSFHILTAVNNPVKVGRDSLMTEVPAGMSCLVPAIFGSYAIHVKPDVETTVVKTSL